MLVNTELRMLQDKSSCLQKIKETVKHLHNNLLSMYYVPQTIWNARNT